MTEDKTEDLLIDLSIEEERDAASKPVLLSSMSTTDFLNGADVKLLDEEKFDFDLDLSPSKGEQRPSVGLVADDDEEEIFFGAVGFRETVAAKVVEETEKDNRPLSPLTQDQEVEIYVEASKLAMMFRTEAKIRKASSTEASTSPANSPSPVKPLKRAPEVSITETTPAPKKRKPSGMFSLDFDSPVIEPPIGLDEIEKQLVEVPTTSLALLTSDRAPNTADRAPNTSDRTSNTSNWSSNNSSVSSSASSSKPSKLVAPFQRSRSLRVPGVRYSAIKKTTTLKRTRTASPKSPSLLKGSENTSSESTSTTAPQSRLAFPPRVLKRPASKSPEPQSAPRKSPRLSTSANRKLKSPSKSPKRSLLKRPSGLQAPSSKPSMLKAPMSKLELIKPGLKRSKLVKPGPMRAGAMDSTLNASTSSVTSNVSSKLSPPAPSLRALKPMQRSQLTTPVKPMPKLAPKKLDVPDTSEISSLLVTPKRSSVSSANNVDSPHPHPPSPAVGILVSFDEENCDPPESTRPKLMYTPQLKEKAAAATTLRQPSGWTPVRRARPHAPEDDYIVCTKRTRIQ